MALRGSYEAIALDRLIAGIGGLAVLKILRAGLVKQQFYF